jgi:hypothetical protein
MLKFIIFIFEQSATAGYPGHEMTPTPVPSFHPPPGRGYREIETKNGANREIKRDTPRGQVMPAPSRFAVRAKLRS